MAYYSDIRQFINELDAQGKLHRIKIPINKDTELMPLVRLQFRGLPEEGRKGFLFENVTDSKGRKFNAQVSTAILGSTPNYAIGLRCKKEEIKERWIRALSNPLEPELVSTGPCKEEIHVGDRLLEHDGLEEFPIPNSTPGFDPGPFLTAPCWVTKDPETGVRNVGTYRAMIKDRLKTGIQLFVTQHIGIHWSKLKAKGVKTMEAAIAIAPLPNVVMTSVAKVPYGLDEYAVAGGLSGEPIKLVKCETIDLEVPATSEIVIEGEITIDHQEPEGPFGEVIGYVGKRTYHPVFNIQCITHRRNPIYYGIISQMPPSESSVVRANSHEPIIYQFLKGILPNVLDVALPQIGQARICVIKMRKLNQAQPWQALNAAVGFDPMIGKIVICVDDDIDPRDPESLLWALYTRVMPHLDIRITQNKFTLLDPSAAPPTAPEEEQRFPSPRGGSALLIDATRKHPYPPTSLPRKEFMERALEIWKQLDLPQLRLREPWYGYVIDFWPEELKEDAERAVGGEYLKTGGKLSKACKIS